MSNHAGFGAASATEVPPPRLANVNDVDALLALSQQFYAHFNYPFVPSLHRRQIADFIAAQPQLGTLWLLCAPATGSAGQVVGYVALTYGYSFEFGGRDAFVDELYIESAHRSSGLASAALTWLQANMPALGLVAMHLQTEAYNQRAKQLYERLAFVDLGRSTLTFRPNKPAATAGVAALPLALLLALLLAPATTSCTKPVVPQATHRAKLQAVLPPAVVAYLQPTLTWGVCWRTAPFTNQRELVSSPHDHAPVAVIMPSRVESDQGADGTIDEIREYRYDGRGNIIATAVDYGGDGLLEEKVTATRDANGAITMARREALFPFLRDTVQTFGYNPYGYLVNTNDFYGKRTFGQNSVTPVALALATKQVTAGALQFELDAAGELVSVVNVVTQSKQRFHTTASGKHVTTWQDFAGSKLATTVDENGRVLESTSVWRDQSGAHQWLTTYRYEGNSVVIAQTEQPQGRCLGKWQVTYNDAGALVGAARDATCDGTVETVIAANLDGSGRIINANAKANDLSVEVTYDGSKLRNVRYTQQGIASQVTYDYDGAGRLVKRTGPRDALSWEYDGQGRVVRELSTADTDVSGGAARPQLRRTFRYDNTPPIAADQAPACAGDDLVAGLVMASELALPVLRQPVAPLFDASMPLNLPTVHHAPAPRQLAQVDGELEAAYRKALASQGLRPVRYELIASRDREPTGDSEGKLAGPIVARDIVECPSAMPRFAVDQTGTYFEVKISKQCKQTVTSPAVDPALCQWGTQPPEFDVVAHVAPGAKLGTPRTLAVPVGLCTDYTGQALPVP